MQRFLPMLFLAACAAQTEPSSEVSPIPPLGRVTARAHAPAELAFAFEIAGPPSLGPSGIRRNSATDFDVERRVLDRLLEQQAELMRCTRVVPEQVSGRPAGFRVFVRPKSALAELGIESGDRIEAINGFDLTSPDKALEAYARLRSADRLAVALVRRGMPMEIEYAIW